MERRARGGLARVLRRKTPSSASSPAQNGFECVVKSRTRPGFAPGIPHSTRFCAGGTRAIPHSTGFCAGNHALDRVLRRRHSSNHALEPLLRRCLGSAFRRRVSRDFCSGVSWAWMCSRSICADRHSSGVSKTQVLKYRRAESKSRKKRFQPYAGTAVLVGRAGDAGAMPSASSVPSTRVPPPFASSPCVQLTRGVCALPAGTSWRSVPARPLAVVDRAYLPEILCFRILIPRLAA